MRVLLDECLPRGLALALKGHHVDTVPKAGWTGMRNGELLAAAADRYDALITIDRRFAATRPVPSTLVLILLKARTNRLESLLPLVPEILRVLESASKGQRVRVPVAIAEGG